MSDLKKIRVQHVSRGADGLEIKTDVDVLTDASAVTMDGKDLKARVKELINDRVGEVIANAPEELDTLKEIADELQKNQSGVSTILKKLGDKADRTDIKTKLAQMTEDEKHRTVTDEDKKKWNNKVDKVDGKVLSTNDFTNDFKTKLQNIKSETSDEKLVYKRKKNTDFNNITEAGFYTVQTNANAPHTQYNYWSLIVLNSSNVDNCYYVQQIAVNERTEDRAIYVRKKDGDSWSSWIKLEAAPDLSVYRTEAQIKAMISSATPSVDMSGYLKTSDIESMTTSEVEAMINEVFK